MWDKTEKPPLTLSELNEVQQELMDQYTNVEFADFLGSIYTKSNEDMTIQQQIQKRLRDPAQVDAEKLFNAIWERIGVEDDLKDDVRQALRHALENM